MDSYLAAAEGDSVAATAAMEADIILFSGEVLLLERDVAVATARGDRYAEWYGIEKQSWFEKLWESEAVKTMIALTFFYLGTQAESW